jgi:small subunit ribosomal protein S17
VGDVVQIVESAPISKEKRWVVESVVNRNLGAELVEA